MRARRVAAHPEPGVLEDRTGLIRRRLGIGDAPTYILVRPDGHVALRVVDDDGPLRAYVTEWLQTVAATK